MGCATKDASGHKIIVSRWSVSSPMIKCLLVHELCHVIRTEEKHPSHQDKLLFEIVKKYSTQNSLDEKTADALRESLTHVQDIYADDIGFPISRDALGIVTMEEFYENWVSETIPDIYGRDESGALATLASNAFALGTLKRRNLLERSGELEIKRKNALFFKAAFRGSSLERASELCQRIATYLATLMEFTEKETELFTRETNRYFDLLLSARAFQ